MVKTISRTFCLFCGGGHSSCFPVNYFEVLRDERRHKHPFCSYLALKLVFNYLVLDSNTFFPTCLTYLLSHSSDQILSEAYYLLGPVFCPGSAQQCRVCAAQCPPSSARPSPYTHSFLLP